MTDTSSNYQLICGMEVHAELKTASKMFCACQNDPFHAPEPNCHTCPVCLGMPGGLPVANKKAIEWTIKLGLALNCEINLFSKFDRKHYFYPDLAKGYQISQYDIPFCYDGYIETSQGRVRIRRIHLEEDTGKLLHTTVNGEKVSLVDFNRCGVPLIEIVTEPDIHSPAQAREYGKKLRSILRYLDIADCDMEQGGMRLEANISLAKPDAKELPAYKVEVKNINSFRFLEQAVNFEMQRQALVLMDGQTPAQETRGWNSHDNVTFPQRTKEDAEDYRYFPDPDLPPMRFTSAWVAELKNQLPALPETVVAKWQKTYAIEPRFAELLIESPAQTAWAESVWTAAVDAKLDVSKLAAAIVNKKLKVELGVTAPAEVVAAFAATTSVEIIDEAELTSLVSEVIAEFPAEVTSYRSGKVALLNFFVGQVMRKLGKKIDAQLIRSALERQL